MSEEVRKDDLLDRHLKANRRRKRKVLITMILLVVVVIGVILAVVIIGRNSVSEQFASSDSSSVQSAEVTTGSISTTVSGSGTLSDEDVESIEILSSLEIASFCVEEGDSVEAGDLLATVTNASLLSAMSEKQSELDAIDTEIAEAAGEEVSETITAAVAGRVKKIAVTSGDDVATVMYNSGALMLLSLDGYMAVDIATSSLSAGASVTVTLSDGTTVSGTVDTVSDGVATVLVSDNGTTYGDSVSVADSDGTSVGSGTLYIHSEMQITGYAGTISAVNVSENTSVAAGDTLLTLTDTETSVSYDALLKEREEIEAQLNELIAIYKEGGVCATIAGEVESLTETAAQATTSSDMSGASSGSSSSYTEVATISPNESMSITISVDETDILSLEEGQEASVTIDSIGEDTFSGMVTEISTSGSSDSGVTTYTAVVTIEKTENMLSGMSATAVITIEGVDNALLIPVEALHQTSATSYVYTEYDEDSGEFSGMVEVETGLSNSSYVEITSGLSEGDTVYYTETEEDSFSMDGMMDMGGGMDSGSFSMPDGDSSGRGGGDMGGSMPGGSN